jgi:hypothetical protein
MGWLGVAPATPAISTRDGATTRSAVAYSHTFRSGMGIAANDGSDNSPSQFPVTTFLSVAQLAASISAAKLRRIVSRHKLSFAVNSPRSIENGLSRIAK